MAAISIQNLFTEAGPSFAQPFEMLSACHDRVRRSLDLLARLQVHLATHGADPQVRQAAADILRYFDLAAPHHHEDEERHVFPVLLARGDATLQAHVRRLEDDHRAMQAAWGPARAVLSALQAGRGAPLHAADQAALYHFASLYTEHLVLEDTQVYPAAQALLAPETLARAGAEMAARRQA